MDPVFNEANAEMISSSAHETSFVQEDEESGDKDSNEKVSRENTIQTCKQIEAVDNEKVDSADDQHQNYCQGLKMNLSLAQLIRKLWRKKCKTVVAPYKKSKQIRSNKQALNEIASGLKLLANSSVRQHQMTTEAEQKREER